MNLEKVVFGFFIILAMTLNFGFFIGDLTDPAQHDVIVIDRPILAMVKGGIWQRVGRISILTSSVPVKLRKMLTVAANS